MTKVTNRTKETELPTVIVRDGFGARYPVAANFFNTVPYAQPLAFTSLLCTSAAIASTITAFLKPAFMLALSVSINAPASAMLIPALFTSAALFLLCILIERYVKFKQDKHEVVASEANSPILQYLIPEWQSEIIHQCKNAQLTVNKPLNTNSVFGQVIAQGALLPSGNVLTKRHYIEKLLPFLKEQAMIFARKKHDIPRKRQGVETSYSLECNFTSGDICGLLAHAWFATLRNSAYDFHDLFRLTKPDETYHPHQIEKIIALLRYFDQQRIERDFDRQVMCKIGRHAENTENKFADTFYLRDLAFDASHQFDMESEAACVVPGDNQASPGQGFIDIYSGTYEKFVCMYPEMLTILHMLDILHNRYDIKPDNKGIMITNVKRFSYVDGCGSTLKVQARFNAKSNEVEKESECKDFLVINRGLLTRDLSLPESHRLQSLFKEQMKSKNLHAELHRTIASFKQTDANKSIATYYANDRRYDTHSDCDVTYEMEPEVSLMIQWVAASICKRSLKVYTRNDELNECAFKDFEQVKYITQKSDLTKVPCSQIWGAIIHIGIKLQTTGTVLMSNIMSKGFLSELCKELNVRLPDNFESRQQASRTSHFLRGP